MNNVTLTLKKRHDQHVTYSWSWNDWHDDLHIGPGASSYGTGITAVMLGGFSRWNKLQQQVYVRDEGGQWYSAEEYFRVTGNPRGIALNENRDHCLATFLEFVMNRWLSDLMLEPSPGPDGA